MPDQIPDDSAQIPDYSDAADGEAAAALESYLVSDDVKTSEVDGVTIGPESSEELPADRTVEAPRTTADGPVPP